MMNLAQVNTHTLLHQLKQVQEGRDSPLGNDVAGYKKELRERAKASGGEITQQESELIEDAANGSISDGDRGLLENLLPAETPYTQALKKQVDGRDSAQLLDVLKHYQERNNTGGGDPKVAVDELKRRASQDGKVSAELNWFFMHSISATKFSDQQWDRYSDLLENDIV